MTEVFIPGNNITVVNINGSPAANITSNAGASTDTAIARFSGATGKILQNSVITVDGVGNLNGVGNINGAPIGSYVAGPVSATNQAIALYNGTTGKIIQNSVITVDPAGNIAGAGTLNGTTIANYVSNAGASTNTAIATFNGTSGKIVQNSVITISPAGNLAGVGTINGNTIATGTNTGDLTLAAVGATPNANGASLAGQVLTLQPADTTNGGVVSITTQSFGGQKDFSNGGITLGPTIASTTNLLQGDAGYYRSSASITVIWDPSGTLFPVAGITGTIRCERIGNLIHISFDRFAQTANGASVLYSNVGAVPAPFRPSTTRGVYAQVLYGGAYGPLYNVVPGWCLLDSAGTLSFGCSQFNNIIYAGIQSDGVNLNQFTGPGDCGFLSQTLVFEF
jgi:hypothetical protein